MNVIIATSKETFKAPNQLGSWLISRMFFVQKIATKEDKGMGEIPQGSCYECNFVEEQEEDGRLIVGPCIVCGIPALTYMQNMEDEGARLRKELDDLRGVS